MVSNKQPELCWISSSSPFFIMLSTLYSYYHVFFKSLGTLDLECAISTPASQAGTGTHPRILVLATVEKKMKVLWYHLETKRRWLQFKIWPKANILVINTSTWGIFHLFYSYLLHSSINNTFGTKCDLLDWCNRIDDNMDESLANVESARSALLRHLNQISSNRWLLLKLFAVIVFFLMVFIIFVAWK